MSITFGLPPASHCTARFMAQYIAQPCHIPMFDAAIVAMSAPPVYIEFLPAFQSIRFATHFNPNMIR
jgi:hypothetical protein